MGVDYLDLGASEPEIMVVPCGVSHLVVLQDKQTLWRWDAIFKMCSYSVMSCSA